LRLWVTSWWGPGSLEDDTTKDVILPHPSLGDHRIALFYETSGRIKEGEGYFTEYVIPDIVYMCQEYLAYPNYFRIDGKPVLVVYLTRRLEILGLLDVVISQMRQAARGEGYEIYTVGDHVFKATDEDALAFPALKDRPTPYATKDDLLNHFQRSKEWQDTAALQNCSFIPSVAPGYNDLGVGPENQHGPLSRQLAGNDSPGSLFRVALQYARRLVEPKIGNVIIVNSFNEWHEDTQIEPVQGESTSLPEDLTHGIEYDGYGELYLNILRNETVLHNSSLGAL